MKDYGEVPYSLEIVNLGSTFAKYGFDYRYFGRKGFNFASAPQPLKVDFEVLQQYHDHIEKGAVVVIVLVCPFEFCVYDYAEMSIKEPLTKQAVWLARGLVKKIIFYDHWKKRKAISLSVEDQSKYNAKSRVKSWKMEFSLENTNIQKPTQKLEETFKKTQNELKKIISLCKEKKFRPVIVSMPMVLEESSCFSDVFLQSFFRDNIEAAEINNVPIIDYFKDERFHDLLLYENYADCLNDRGRQLFAQILIDDLRKLGFWEEK